MHETLQANGQIWSAWKKNMLPMQKEVLINGATMLICTNIVESIISYFIFKNDNLMTCWSFWIYLYNNNIHDISWEHVIKFKSI
jgi:hypothetical protein